MTRRAIIILLTLASVAFVFIWIDSYRQSGPGRRWFLGPRIYADSAECAFQSDLDHVGCEGWHLWSGRLDEPGDHYVCAIAPRSSISVRWMTLSAAQATSPEETTSLVRRVGGVFEFEAWRGFVERSAGSFAYSAWHVRLPIWFPLLVCGSLPIYVLIRRGVRRWRQRRVQGAERLCLSCLYDLTGNVSGVCPECGTKIKST